MKPVLPFASLLVIAALAYAQEPDSDKAFKNALALQKAMERANAHLLAGQPRQAVDALEAELPRVSGNSSYLLLLRKSYRAYITQLWLGNQADLAKRYTERLCVLEPSAAADATLRPAAAGEKRIIERPPVPAALAQPPLPSYGTKTASGGPPKSGEATLAEGAPLDRGPKPSTVRAHADEASVDPFDPAFRRADAERDGRVKLARMLAGRADDQFALHKYAEARQLYEQAYQADREVLAPTKDRYAYCMLDQVAGEVNRGGLVPDRVPALKQAVTEAVGLSPRLQETGNRILRELDLRQKDLMVAAAPKACVEAQHLGRNKEGWNVTETEHFRIFHHQGAEFAEKVAQIAERTRLAMYRKWFGNGGVDWTPKCELVLHQTGADYQKMTGVPATSPGHSRIESDPTGKRVVSRRMDLRIDHPGFMEAVLPHETTHVVLAGMFGSQVVPRWADEGIAVLTEPDEKVQQHRRNLQRSASAGELFALKELMELSDYPTPRRIGAFYAESVAVCDFLARQKGPTVLTQFIRDGVAEGYEASLRRHYGVDFATLETQWRGFISTSSPIASR